MLQYRFDSRSYNRVGIHLTNIVFINNGIRICLGSIDPFGDTAVCKDVIYTRSVGLYFLNDLRGKKFIPLYSLTYS